MTKNIKTPECIHQGMYETIRCPKCSRPYSRGNKEYNTPMKRCYVRKDAGTKISTDGNEYNLKNWVKICWMYCPDCKTTFKVKNGKVIE